jgi:hypothetical protein
MPQLDFFVGFFFFEEFTGELSVPILCVPGYAIFLLICVPKVYAFMV